MLNRNEGFANLTAGYLFPEVARRRREYAAAHPGAKIISLGIGNTTEPLPKFIAKAMADYSLGLATAEGYSGYGDEQGNTELRKKIASSLIDDSNDRICESEAHHKSCFSGGVGSEKESPHRKAHDPQLGFHRFFRIHATHS